jgi:hypothetical protein
MKGKIKYNFDSYFSVVFVLYIFVVKPNLDIEQLRRILIFVAKSFYYLDNWTKSQLL